jgi:hypothetical protein
MLTHFLFTARVEREVNIYLLKATWYGESVLVKDKIGRIDGGGYYTM